jgi:hypothetical protein
MAEKHCSFRKRHFIEKANSVRSISLLLLSVALLATPIWLGCSSDNTVKPAEAEKVPANAPVGEEKPSTDEQ